MRYLVFVDMDYYPYVGRSVEADTPEEAFRLACENEQPGIGTDIYVVPMDAVMSGVGHGPRPEPQGLLKLMEESNRLRAERLDFGGGFSVHVEPGTMEPGG